MKDTEELLQIQGKNLYENAVIIAASIYHKEIASH